MLKTTLNFFRKNYAPIAFVAVWILAFFLLTFGAIKPAQGQTHNPLVHGKTKVVERLSTEYDYTPHEPQFQPMSLDQCMLFIAQSPEQAGAVGLDLGEPITVASNYKEKLLVIKYPFTMAEQGIEGFIKITCNDGFIVKITYVYNGEAI